MNHRKMQFELWLMGQNADIQKKYWTILKESKWNINRKDMPKYSVLEVVVEEHIDFHNKENMTTNIINQSVSLALEIEEYLKNVDC